jgi:large repetitive protein
MPLRLHRHRGTNRRFLRVDRDESGDTLIEILIAIVLISLSVVALLGTLTETITSSAEHRSLSTLDTVLKNFADAVKYDVQFQPAANSIYAECATNYQAVSVYPTSAPAGTGATVFGTDFPPNQSATVKIGSFSSTTTVNGNGSVSATVTLPSNMTVGSQAVSVTVGASTATAVEPLNVLTATGASTPSPVAGYSVVISSIGWWNSATSVFDTSTCAPNDRSGIQEVNLTAATPTNINENLSVVVVNPAFNPPKPAPTFTISNGTPQAGQPLTFTATLTGSTGGFAPSATGPSPPFVWNLMGSPGNPSCTFGGFTTNGNVSTTTCSVTTAQVGVYQVAANYSGDTNYSPATATKSATVPQLSSTVTLTLVSPAHPTVGGPSLDYRATVNGSAGITPNGGTVKWQITPPSGNPVSCAASTVSGGAGNSVTAQPDCVIPTPLLGTYTVTATYTGDPNYLASPPASLQTTVHNPLTITSVQLKNGPGTAGQIGRSKPIDHGHGHRHRWDRFDRRHTFRVRRLHPELWVHRPGLQCLCERGKCHLHRQWRQRHDDHLDGRDQHADRDIGEEGWCGNLRSGCSQHPGVHDLSGGDGLLR